MCSLTACGCEGEVVFGAGAGEIEDAWVVVAAGVVLVDVQVFVQVRREWLPQQ